MEFHNIPLNEIIKYQVLIRQLNAELISDGLLCTWTSPRVTREHTTYFQTLQLVDASLFLTTFHSTRSTAQNSIESSPYPTHREFALSTLGAFIPGGQYIFRESAYRDSLNPRVYYLLTETNIPDIPSILCIDDAQDKKDDENKPENVTR